MQNLSTKPAPSATRKYATFFILFFLSAQIFLMARCYFTDAKYFGWQMFSGAVYCRTHFYGIKADGRREELPREFYRHLFRGKAGAFFVPREREAIFFRGENFHIRQSSRLPEFLCREGVPPGAYRKIEVHVDYRDPVQGTVTERVFSADCGS